MSFLKGTALIQLGTILNYWNLFDWLKVEERCSWILCAFILLSFIFLKVGRKCNSNNNNHIFIFYSKDYNRGNNSVVIINSAGRKCLCKLLCMCDYYLVWILFNISLFRLSSNFLFPRFQTENNFCWNLTLKNAIYVTA